MTQLRVRARAVDMLGRQQIAGIPTAIHELFKNAHDAYAERVEVDFFRRSNVLVLRDDGYGMTREEVESRWLTLGTESRVGANKESSNDEWRGPKNLPKRSIMGEKGIGRLAIAVIAPITILMTRAVRKDGLHDLVVALVHWGIFEQPGLDVSEIDVPLEEFSGGILPTREDIVRLVEKVSSNLDTLEAKIDQDAYRMLKSDLQSARSIAPNLLDDALRKDKDGNQLEAPLSLLGEGYGTHFIVLPVAPELKDDIDNKSDKDSSNLERYLLGFSNSMMSDDQIIKTEFRDHTIDGVEERIGPQTFFKDEDFSKTDQYFEGDFDEYGQFVGKVSIYGQVKDFVCNWTDGNGRLPKCGPFSFRYGYVQGRSAESRLSPEDWSEMTAKTGRVGGLYIYRDGIRILPYGNSEFDWLDIEKRRTLAAKDWFFSYRRGFGYVAISHSINGTLTEKAGREGFRENLAYRDFRSILINFFKQLAYEFFRVSSPQGDDYNSGKSHFAAQAALLKKQKEKADARRSQFQKDLDEFFDDYNGSYYEKESDLIREYFKERLFRLSNELDIGDFASRVRSLDIDVKQKIRALVSKATLSVPRGLALTKRQQRDWPAYEDAFLGLQSEFFDPLRIEFETSLKEVTGGRIAASERRSVALQEIEREKDSVFRDVASLRKETSEALDLMQDTVRGVLKEEFSGLRVAVERLVDEFTKRSAERPDDLDAVRHEIELKLSEVRVRELELLDSFKRQMTELAAGAKDRETLDDRFGALEARNLILEEQLEFYSDFAQLGMSVGILQHEFFGAARGIRSAMADLKPWADRNPPLALIYSRLRDHIEHLDGYLKALDPLGRRMHRSTVRITGDEILRVVLNVFVEPLEAFNIKVEPTFAFRDYAVECKSSVVVGAFINVIDNAIYWLNSRSARDRRIFLDADSEGFLISNNGPGIEDRYRDRIFEFGETRKVGGRGMGLAISREALRREGFEIDLVGSGVDVNPVFRISPIKAKDEQGEQ
ncbi:ATP-binding protein [Pseudomonas sp. MT3]